MFIILQMSLHILCITNTTWSVWPFTTFPCVVFCTFFAKCASKIGDDKTWASPWWKWMALGYSWKAAGFNFYLYSN